MFPELLIRNGRNKLSRAHQMVLSELFTHVTDGAEACPEDKEKGERRKYK